MKKYKLHKLPEGFIITENSDVCGTIAFDEDSHSIMFFASHPKYDESGKQIIAINYNSDTYPLLSLPHIDFSALSDEDTKKIDRYNIYQLASEEFPHIELLLTEKLSKEEVPYVPRKQREAYELGFQKAQELLVDKQYTLDDLINAAKYGYEFRHITSFPNDKFEDGCINNFKQKLQSNEYKSWDIEILEKENNNIIINKLL